VDDVYITIVNESSEDGAPTLDVQNEAGNIFQLTNQTLTLGRGKITIFREID